MSRFAHCRNLYLLALAMLSGCATIDAREDYLRVSGEVERSVGHATASNPEDDANTEAAVTAILSDGITADEAVRLCLLNNPEARTALLSVGIARADVVQAGLWSNPTIGFSVRLPEGGGLSNLEASIAQNIANLWMIPARERAAERDLDRTILQTARALVGLALQTKQEYFNAVAARETMNIARDNVSLTKQLLALSEARLEAGTVGSLDVNLAKAQALKAEVGYRTARLAFANQKRTLAKLMGLTVDASELSLVDPLPAPMDRSLHARRYVEVALDARLDARAAREAVEASAARVEFELASVFKDVSVGIEVERNASRSQPGRNVLADTARSSIANGQLTAPSIQPRADRRQSKRQQIEAILGPSLSLTLPIFDQNQAQIAKARTAYLQTRATLEAIERSIVQDTRTAADQLATAWELATLFEREVLPQAKLTLEISETTYQSGQVTILNVIDAQRSLLEVRGANIAALQSAASAIVALERATARPIAELLSPSLPTQMATETTTE